MRKNNIKCPNCKYSGQPEKYISGSAIIETILWIIGLVALFFFPIFIIVSIGYSIWRSSSKYSGCPKCGYAHIFFE